MCMKQFIKPCNQKYASGDLPELIQPWRLNLGSPPKSNPYGFLSSHKDSPTYGIAWHQREAIKARADRGDWKGLLYASTYAVKKKLMAQSRRDWVQQHGWTVPIPMTIWPRQLLFIICYLLCIMYCLFVFVSNLSFLNYHSSFYYVCLLGLSIMLYLLSFMYYLLFIIPQTALSYVFGVTGQLSLASPTQPAQHSHPEPRDLPAKWFQPSDLS